MKPSVLTAELYHAVTTEKAMNKEQMNQYRRLETIKERAEFLLEAGVTARANIVGLDVVCQAFVGETSLPVTAATEADAIAKGIAWLKEKAGHNA